MKYPLPTLLLVLLAFSAGWWSHRQWAMLPVVMPVATSPPATPDAVKATSVIAKPITESPVMENPVTENSLTDGAVTESPATDNTEARLQALLASGERRQAIEWLYSIVHYVPDGREQMKMFDTIHGLAVEEYHQRSHQQEWRELESFYQYLLTQENAYLPYYLHYAAVLMKLQQYTAAENYLLPLLNDEQFREPARQMLARLTLLRAGGQVLPLQTSGTNYVATATLNGVTPVNLMLDTGASLSVIDPGILQQLSASDYERLPNNLSLQTANGVVQASLYRIRYLQLGEYRLQDIEFAVLPLGGEGNRFNGLLGMNVLNHFHFEIDQINQELVLQPHP